MKYKKLCKYTNHPITPSPHQSLVANINVFDITTKKVNVAVFFETGIITSLSTLNKGKS